MANTRPPGHLTGPKDPEVTTPFTTAAKGAALRRMKQTQLGVRTAMTLTQAAAKGREEAKRKAEQEEAAKMAAAAALEAAEKEDAMEVEVVGLEGGGKEDETTGQRGYDSDDSPIARDLDKEMATSSGKKRRGGDLIHPNTDTPKAMTALRRTSYKPHSYSHPRVIIEGSARLGQEDKIKEFTDLIGALLSNGKMVDQHFAIVPVTIGAGRRDLREVKDIPANMTMLGGYVKISDKSLRAFERKSTPRPKDGKSVRKDTYLNDMIYFTLAIACDTEPREIISGISVEWMRAGGVGLYRKEIQAFNTMSPFVIFYLYNNTSVQTVMAEFRRMMEEAIKLLEEADGTDPLEMQGVPNFAFRKSFPKLPGAEPEEFAGLKPRQAAARKAWHVEMEVQHVHQFARLIETCKEVRLFDLIWGGHVMISEVVDYDSPPGDVKRVLKAAKKHTCFQVSMTGVQLYGITDLDTEVACVQTGEGDEEGGNLSLRAVLLRHLRTRDGSSPLFAEVHQKQSGGVVEAVVPNTQEAESMVGSLNRHMPAFLKHYLLYRGLPEDFVTRLIVASCCPTLVSEINTVRWDEKHLDLITTEDAEEEARLSAFEKSDWFMDLEQLHVSAKKKKHFTAPEALFNLDEVRSVKTLHAKNDEKRAAAWAEAEDYTSEEEHDSVSTTEAGKHDKSSQDLAVDTAVGTGDKSITWSPSSPSDGRPATQGAAGSG